LDSKSGTNSSVCHMHSRWTTLGLYIKVTWTRTKINIFRLKTVAQLVSFLISMISITSHNLVYFLDTSNLLTLYLFLLIISDHLGSQQQYYNAIFLVFLKVNVLFHITARLCAIEQQWLKRQAVISCSKYHNLYPNDVGS